MLRVLICQGVYYFMCLYSYFSGPLLIDINNFLQKLKMYFKFNIL